MSYRYTFTGHDFESILHNVHIIAPGITKVLAIFKPSAEDEVRAMMRNRPDRTNDIESLHIIDRMQRISELRDHSKRFDWLDETEIGIEKDRSTISKSEIFDELKKNVLLLRYRNEFDGLNDLLFVYLNTNQGNYGLSRSDKVLEGVQKGIIEYHMYHAFNSFLMINRQNRNIHQRINTDTQALISENRQLKELLKLSELTNRNGLKNLAEQYCYALSVKNKKNYLLTDQAYEKIQSFKGNINYLSKIIENAIVYAENISLKQESEICYIDDWHINLSHFEVPKVDEMPVKSFTEQKYANTIALLNRLENGAKIVLSQNEKLTGINVGMACNKPMKAPGITDALKNHKSKILTLFRKYPNKWEIIRTEFTPVKNLIVSSLRSDQLSA